MKKTNRLSHSSVSKFQFCGHAWDLHYNKRIRAKIQKSSLLFGSAVDAGLQAMLKPEDKSPEDKFNELWNFAEVNGVRTYIPTCVDVVYSDSDADIDLLDKEDVSKLSELYTNEWEEELSRIIERKKSVGFKGLKYDDKRLLNHYNWLCLRHKGLLMLKAYKTKVMPKITEVLGVQVYVKLENDQNDSVIGYADLVCRFQGHKEPIIFDNKTSSIDYDEDKVLTSPQLTLYVDALSDQYENTKKAGFIVLHKRIIKNRVKICSQCGYDGTGARHKTCNNFTIVDGDSQKEARCNGEWEETINPECKVQIIIDEIPEQTTALVMENIDNINQAIKNEVYVRNLNSCVSAWGKCEFYNRCYKGSDEGLVDLNKVEETLKKF